MRQSFLYEYNRDRFADTMSWVQHQNCFPAHFHSSLEFIYMESGTLHAVVNGQVYTVGPHDFLIVPSYSVHSYDTPDPIVCHVLTVPLGQIPSYGGLFSQKMFASTLVRHPRTEHRLKDCMAAIGAYGGAERSPVTANIVKGYAYVFLGLMIGEAGLADIPDSGASSFAQEVLVYLQEHYRSPLTPEKVASRFGYSQSRFSHVFSRCFGCTLVSYLNSLRCQAALDLMERRDLTVTEIAYASGFESARSFYRSFKACFGCPPKQYLRAGDVPHEGRARPKVP